jgi:hypothetical protein
MGGANTGSGGIGGTGGTVGSSSVHGMPCTTDQDCPSDATCCDGSDPSCDGTKLPSGDGPNVGEFVVSADGLTVADTTTGLVWQRDGSGARTGCTGFQNLYCSLAEAQAYCGSLVLAGLSGWRLPSWMELLTISDLSLSTTDQATFLAYRAGYWTSSVCTGCTFPSAAELYVDFGSSVAYSDDVSNEHFVRCVRGGRCYPKTRLVPLDGGLVRDALTGLVWQQQGSGTAMTWADAQSYCSSLGSGFRLPTLKEIDSLVDITLLSGPAPDEPFPSTGDEEFWTSTSYTNPDGSSVAYYGDFSAPNSNATGQHGLLDYTSGARPLESKLNVRCVR